MIATAKIKNLRIAPRKVRLVADLIRGKYAREAEVILKFAVKRGTQDLLKLLQSAIANAKTNSQATGADLYIKKIFVDEGPKYKRWRPRARGQSYQIQKKTSHVTIVLEGKKLEERTMPLEEKNKKVEKTSKISKKPFSRPESDFLRPKAERSTRKIFKRQVF